MAKIDNINIIEPWEYDRLYPILQDAFRVLLISYQNLYAQKQKIPYIKPLGVKKWQLEDMITDDLIRDEEMLPKAFEYRIVNQQKDATKNTRIDIAIQWSLTFGLTYDIKIECKLLNKGNLTYIINGGIEKFRNNTYSPKLPLAGMLYYNTSGILTENIELLNAKIEQKISAKETLQQFKIIENYQHTFFSKHKRISNLNIDLYTGVLDFKDVIDNSEKSKSV